MHTILSLHPMQFLEDIQNLDQRHVHNDSISCNNQDHWLVLEKKNHAQSKMKQTNRTIAYAKKPSRPAQNVSADELAWEKGSR